MAANTHESNDTDNYSKRLGELLLQGWTMLDRICPRDSCNGVPLMRSRDPKPKFYCVACQNTLYETSDGTLQSSAQISQSNQVETSSNPIPSARGHATWDFSDETYMALNRIEHIICKHINEQCGIVENASNEIAGIETWHGHIRSYLHSLQELKSLRNSS